MPVKMAFTGYPLGSVHCPRLQPADMTEAEFIAALKRLPLHPAARDLGDDTAVLAPAGSLVLTKDMIVEGVHFLPDDPPGDVAWKLLAVNLSDLAAKGAEPVGVLLGYMLGDNGWDAAFLTGLDSAMRRFDCPLLGGDTVAATGARTLSLTAIGRAESAPARSGAQAGDALWVTGTIGDAGAGLAIAQGEAGPDTLLDRYRRPVPRLAEGRALAPIVHAMMDVSDGLLIDASRMAVASGLAVDIALDAVPLSDALIGHRKDNRDSRMAAVTAGDDYELLFALPPGTGPSVPATRVGSFNHGSGLLLTDGGAPIPLPDRTGFEHRR
ncbi:thiamine-phosphate kinase [Stakelama sediminis]